MRGAADASAKGHYADQTCPREMSTNHEQTTPPQNSEECPLFHTLVLNLICVVIAFLECVCVCMYSCVYGSPRIPMVAHGDRRVMGLVHSACQARGQQQHAVALLSL